MQKGTLNYNQCKKCGNSFVVGWEGRHLENYCADCENEGWFEDMKEIGCATADPTRLGQLPHIIPKERKDLPTIDIKGIRHTDVTDLLFESDKHTKVYPGNKEWKDIQKYENRKKSVRTKDEVKIEDLERIIAESTGNRATVKELRNLGYNGEIIRRGLKLTPSKYGAIIRDLRDSGEITVITKKNYSREEELQILKMAEQGIDIKTIAKKLGRNGEAVRNKLVRLRKSGLC